MNNFNRVSDLDAISLGILYAIGTSPGCTSKQIQQKVELSETAINSRLRQLCSANVLDRRLGFRKGKGPSSYRYYLSKNISMESVQAEITKKKAEKYDFLFLLENFPQEEQSLPETYVVNEKKLDFKFDSSSIQGDEIAVRDGEPSTSSSGSDENTATKQEISTEQEAMESNANQPKPEKKELEQEFIELSKQHIFQMSRDPSLKKLQKAFDEIIDNLSRQEDIILRGLENCISTNGNQLNVKFSLSVSSKKNNKEI